MSQSAVLVRSPAVCMVEVRMDWKKPYFGAVPYIQALGSLDSWDGQYGLDEVRSLGLYFLANANSWRGEIAQRVKAEIAAACKQ